jgi:protein-S-isoprenylcysteine O-methyltransferase Ste14
VPPGVYFLAAFLLGVAFDRFAPLRFPQTGWLQAPAWILVAGAVVLAATAIVTLVRAGTTIRPDRAPSVFSASGPFRFTRNPMYLALVWLYIGIALLTRQVWPLPLLPLAVLVMHLFVIPGEERLLHQRFGATYDAYRGRVRRWL